MEPIKKLVWEQLGASIDMLRNAITACPEKNWDDKSQFWYIAYHTLFMLDYYMSAEPNQFHPPAPFTMSEMDPSGLMPERTYTKEELLTYLAHCREKCFQRVSSVTSTTMFDPVTTYNRDYPALEIFMFNTRHVQHHTAQLNLLLRQAGTEPPGWVSRAE